ncbi:MAG: TonB-dependent receptor plug domain-containing protein, partial [Bacteroidetes bacterium]|nr:TonB-dependent receptor plug domain-containing protein [Bacteroidota bacterium]
DQNGRFVFDKLMIIDSLRCKIQAHTAKNGRNVVVTVDDSLPKLPNYGISATTDSAIIIRAATPASQPVRNIPDKIPTNGHAKALKGVTIKATKPLLDNSSNLNGPGNADQVVLMKNIHEGCATIANCLQGKLNFVTISFNQWGVGSFFSRYGNMAIYVDGVPSNPELLNQMSPQTIESVEVLLPGGLAAVYGPGAQDGVILINTKRWGDYNDLNASNVLTHTIAGFQRVPVFYSPKYDHTGPGNIADNRVAVYWKPNIITGKDGHAWIEYYNADTKGTYRVVIEGIDDQGRIGRQVYRYKVE